MSNDHTWFDAPCSPESSQGHLNAAHTKLNNCRRQFLNLSRSIHESHKRWQTLLLSNLVEFSQIVVELLRGLKQLPSHGGVLRALASVSESHLRSNQRNWVVGLALDGFQCR